MRLLVSLLGAFTIFRMLNFLGIRFCLHPAFCEFVGRFLVLNMLNFLGILFCLHPTFGESPGRFYYFFQKIKNWESVATSIRLLVSLLNAFQSFFMLNFLGILFCLHPTFGESPGRFYYFLDCSTSWESVSASIRLLVSPLVFLSILLCCTSWKSIPASIRLLVSLLGAFTNF